MNALIKKEIRLLLPNFLIGCALAFSTWFLLWRNHGAISGMLPLFPFVVCPAVVMMIALDSFGVEISSGTFTALLAQPVSRQKIWQTKILLLMAALLVIGILWFGSMFCVRIFLSSNRDNLKDFYDLFVATIMFGLAVFSGGLWTVLLLRQVAAAFWFTILVPGVILVILVGLFADYSGEFQEGMITSVLGLYSLAGFFFARWLFFRAQDLQWSGGTIAMPEMRGLPAWFSKAATTRVIRPRAALWRKEFQLHQSQFIMAFALLLLHLGILATRHFCDLRKSPDLKFVLEIFWGLWLVMPVLVGCAAVAEERKLGTLEGQLGQPVKRRTQFAIKFSVALFLSVLLGAVMPLLLEGTKILPNVHFEFDFGSGWQSHLSTAQLFFWDCFRTFTSLLPVLVLTSIAATFGVISFYVSSFARNTLQTLAPAVLGILLTFFTLVTMSQMGNWESNFLWRGPLIYLIGVPIMLLALIALAFWNFQHVRTGWKMWRWNFFMLVLALAFAMTATSAIYHRAWEKLTPFEPAHSEARLSRSNPASLSEKWNEIFVRLPAGKIWTAQFEQTRFSPLAQILGNFKVALSDGQFINGSNWLTVNQIYREWVGIKTDGTLWVSEKPQPVTKLNNGNERSARNLVQFGNGTNWNSMASFYDFSFLVKSDGTLWRWGTTHFDARKHQWPGLRAFTPERMGTESNWAKVYQNDSYQLLLCKTDGSLWTWNDNWNTNGRSLLKVAPDFVVASVGISANENFRSTAQIYYGLQYKVGVRNDGTFRIWADEHVEHNKRFGNYEWYPTDLQIGNGTNWLAVAGYGEKIVTLKNDGSLWLWNFHYNPFEHSWNPNWFEHEVQNTRPVRLGTHSDWIAITGVYDSVTTLAADGSLWFWPLENASNIGEFSGAQYFNNGDSHFVPLLDISRKPRLLGNVFGKAN